MLPPHPVLTAYYGKEAERARFLCSLFDATAGDYDRLTQVFSFGAGRRYRARAVEEAGLAPGSRVLDVATGTGMLAVPAERLVGPSGSVTALDPSPGMLCRARRHRGLILVQGLAEALPFADAVFDFLSMGYALRHVAGVDTAFSEFARVLKPGGRLLVLEISRPEGRLAQHLAGSWLGRLVPALSRLAPSGRDAAKLMRYFWDTIETCVSPETILAALHANGLGNARSDTKLGIFRSYTATR
ncbi:MAG: class I SAM-dependent methyltransferase [Acetobacteraceae bacterium]